MQLFSGSRWHNFYIYFTKNHSSQIYNRTKFVPDCTHFSEFIDCFKSVVDTGRQQLGKLLVVEDLEGTAWRNFADGAGVELVVVITVTRLNKYGTVRQTLSVYLPTNVIQMNALNKNVKLSNAILNLIRSVTFSYVSACIFYGRVSVHIGQLAEAESV